MSISRLLNTINSKQDAFGMAKYLYRDRLAPDFNLFDFIEPDEMRLSNILAWLLSPQASHGQGGKFLRLFLHRLSVVWPIENCNMTQVRTESWVPEGRLDVVVQSGSRILIIENKPWAAEQPNQLERYLSYLDRLKTNNGQPGANDSLLVYITADGLSPPGSMSEKEWRTRIEAGQLHCWSYREDISKWLSECRAACRADRVSTFIDEFVQYIRKQFEGANDMKLQDHVVQEILRSPESVSAAMEVITATDVIRTKLLAIFKDQLEAAIAKQEGWRLTGWNMRTYNRHSGFSISFSESSRYSFGFEFDYTQYNGLVYGVVAKEETRDHGDIPQSIEAQVGPGGGAPTPWWPWYRYTSSQGSHLAVEQNWHQAVAPWVAIADGTLVGTVIKAAEHVRDVMARCDLL